VTINAGASLVLTGDTTFTMEQIIMGAGSTLTLAALRGLGDGYLVLSASFEGMDDSMFADSASFARGLIRKLRRCLEMDAPDRLPVWDAVEARVDRTDLAEFINQFVQACGKPVVLLIDEVDKSSNSQTFLSFLGILRDQYLLQRQGRVHTFHSVVLAGVHDIKSLKLKVREGAETKLNSPWNIAADFTVDLSFNPAEIATLLADFASENPVQMDMPAIAERIHYFSSGHPFLVSKLCKILDEEAGHQNPDFDPVHWTVPEHRLGLSLADARRVHHHQLRRSGKESGE
jgi:hypothetical protein